MVSNEAKAYRYIREFAARSEEEFRQFSDDVDSAVLGVLAKGAEFLCCRKPVERGFVSYWDLETARCNPLIAACDDIRKRRGCFSEGRSWEQIEIANEHDAARAYRHIREFAEQAERARDRYCAGAFDTPVSALGFRSTHAVVYAGVGVSEEVPWAVIESKEDNPLIAARDRLHSEAETQAREAEERKLQRKIKEARELLASVE